MLKSNHSHIVEQAVWALGNIAGDGAESRDLVLREGVMPNLLSLINYHETQALFLRNVIWAISNLCRNKNPPPSFIIVQPCIPYICELMMRTSDTEMITDACWALSYLTDGPNEKIQVVVDQGIVPRLVELLGCNHFNVLTPVLRVIGNIVTGNDDQTEVVLNAGVLNKLIMLLQCSKNNLVKEAAWTISNITAGTPAQIQRVLDSGVMPFVVKVLQNGEFRSQREAAWAVTNFTSGCTPQQLVRLLSLETANVVAACCRMLHSRDNKTVIIVLDGITNMLKKSEKIGEFESLSLMLEQVGGVNQLEELQNHESEEIYSKSYHIIDTYFSPDNQEYIVPDDELAGNAPPDSTFEF